jgi:hypothetical protein
MATRTTILLDDETRKAARSLAAGLGCSTSEVIRRAVRTYWQSHGGVTPEQRMLRKKAFLRLIERSKGMDVEAELRRLDEEGEGF